MPYLPPPPEDLEPEIDCVLVFIPNNDEYRRAFYGQIADLCDVWNWEADRTTQATIRQVWLDAYLQTLDCANMACLDEIIALLEEIRDHEWCCETVDSVTGGDEITGVDDSSLPPDVDRDGGTLPPDWDGDPDGYDAYLCGQAHRLAESTDEAVDAVFDTILLASNVVVFATLLVLAFGNVIGMGIAAIIAGGYSLVTASEVFGFFSVFTELREALSGGDPQGLVAQTKAEMSAIYDDIVDAVFCANDAAEATATMHALVDANVTSTSYAALLRLLYTISLRPIFWGFGGAADRFDCVDCLDPTDIDVIWSFDDDDDGWDFASCRAGYDAANDCMNYGSGPIICGWGRVFIDLGTLESQLSLPPGTTYEIVSITATLWITASNGTQDVIGYARGDTAETILIEAMSGFPTVPTEWFFEPTGIQFHTTNTPDSTRVIEFSANGASSNSVDIKVDNVRLRANIV